MEPNVQEACETDAEEAQKMGISLEITQASGDIPSQIKIDNMVSSDCSMGTPTENIARCEMSTQIIEPGQNKIPGLTFTSDVSTTDTNSLQECTDLAKRKIAQTDSHQLDHNLQFTNSPSNADDSTVIDAEVSSGDFNLLTMDTASRQQSACKKGEQSNTNTEIPSRASLDEPCHSAGTTQETDYNMVTRLDENIEIPSVLSADQPCLTTGTIPQSTGRKRGRPRKIVKEEKDGLICNQSTEDCNVSLNAISGETGPQPVILPQKRRRKPKCIIEIGGKTILSCSSTENGGGSEIGTPHPVKIPKKQGRKSKHAKEMHVDGVLAHHLSAESTISVENGSDSPMGSPQPLKILKKRGRKPKQVNEVPVDGGLAQPLSAEGTISTENGGSSQVGEPQAVKIPKKRGRKPKNAEVVSAEGDQAHHCAEGIISTENGGDMGTPQPVKIPKKRGRKPKSEMVPKEENTDTHGLLKPIVQRLLDESGADEELTASGRPKRRAARAALLYLHEIVAEIKSPTHLVDEVTDSANANSDRDQSQGQPQSPPKRRQGRKRKKFSDDDFDDVSEDKDFEIDGVSEEDEEDEEEEFSEADSSSGVCESDLEDLDDSAQKLKRMSINKQVPSSKPRLCGNFANGLHNTIMVTVWESTTITKEHREKHHSSWVFPEWIPSSQDWTFLSQSESLQYLPDEPKSALFTIKREGIQEDSTTQSLGRFQSLPTHNTRWDISFFVGGPVWSMEWCPTPEGSATCQYAAIYCNKRMDDRHSLKNLNAGPALLQIWQLGDLQQDSCPQMNSAFAYGVATDHGCIWDMKWCPSGAWELPETTRKSPQVARLGILAVAFSTGKIVIYSLPHPKPLTKYKMLQSKGSSDQEPIICKVQCNAILEIGSVHFGATSQCGQCFCLDWMPSKEHLHVAAGFYDGTVGLWNLTTKSLLLRVRQADRTLKIYPFHSFVAHDHAVKAIAWSKCHSDFLVTASPDRKIKFWDLKRTYHPLNVLKRHLNTEVSWLVPWCGVMVAQENCYSAFGLSGIHFVDAGYLGYKPYFAAPRTGSVWSVSGSDWLNTCASGDNSGEVIGVILPDCKNTTMNVKRPNERRFPVYKADMVEHNSCGRTSTRRLVQGKETLDSSEIEKDNVNTRTGPKTYSEAVKQYYLQFDDTDLRSFKDWFCRAPFLRMQAVDKNTETYLGRMPLESVHKVRFNPNLDAHGWVISGGQSGIVRAHCVQSLNTHVSRKLIKECQAQFKSMFQPKETDVMENPVLSVVSHNIELAVQTE
ncbi:general transcription factor 3C polypeptide 2 [Callorhinchus milii]|uniref:general transcription factor 3C polypeptide 2 n=1 Tax=Callorhinchus milii TaxID=7868 RepID=UPI001C3F60BC|nr:general transcription factor 3C polypeptide 2 [Callorhinchus milii]